MYAVIQTGGKQYKVAEGDRGFTYKNKSNQRRSWGHRQHYSTIEITGISKS